MSGPANEPGPASASPPAVPPATAHVRRSKFSLVWVIPLVALAIAAYLGVRTIRTEGPTITITWRTGDGLAAGQTKVRHKAVELGLVESVRLSDDMRKVVATVKMRREAGPYLTDKARFWVVRPRLSAGSISGIETLVSGSYIEMDPGTPEGTGKSQFVGLENPPGVRSGEPGTTYQVRAERIGSLSTGAPVFFRDINVGEVLSYELGNGIGPVTLTVFVKEPFDKLVRKGSHFWNASGLSLEVGADGIHLELASLQALLSGGVAFDTPSGDQDKDPKPVAPGTEFPLYRNYQDAQNAGYTTRQTFVTYFESSVRGLSRGSAVEFFGMQIGTVTDVKLDIDAQVSRARVRVAFEVQPERIAEANSDLAKENPIDVARRLVERSMRAQLKTSSYITGTLILALDFVPGAPKADLYMEGEYPVVPSVGGGLDGILATASSIAAKLNRIPLDEIGTNLNGTLRSASGALVSIESLARKADQGLSPVLSRLPAVVASLQDAAVRAGRTFGSLETSYGRDSQFSRELERAMVQVGDTARSIRLLADFLDRHPEALIRGRAGATR